MKLKNKLLLGGLTAVLLAVMSFSAWKIWVIRSEYHTGEAAYEDISHMISLPQKTAEPQPPVINKPAGAETLPDEDDTVWPEVDFAVLREINPDIVAWIYIEGTKINYPIVQGGDNSYYLKHLFSGEWNGSGCIFLDFRNDASFADRHSIIYGHHMKNGTMFSDLERFKKKEFWEEHKTFRFDTLYVKQTYEVIAVFKTAVYTGSENEFKYYQFVDAAVQEQFDGYIQRAKEKAFYDTGVSAEYGDKLITLSTCEYSGQNSRLVVVAKKVTESGGSNAPSNDGATEIQS